MKLVQWLGLGTCVIAAAGCGGSSEENTSLSGGTQAADTGTSAATSTTSASATTSAATTEPGGTTTGVTSGGSTGNPFIYDVGAPGTTTGGEGEPVGCFPSDRCECPFDAHVPCDDGTDDPFVAMGLNCPNEPNVMGSVDGAPVAHGLRSSFGANSTFDPREGTVYAVMSTGDLGELEDETPQPDFNMNPTYCNTDVGGQWDMGGMLPAPILTNDVGGAGCETDPNLIGTGDCSNSIEGQFSQGESAEDYAELRIEASVPDDVEAFRFDFAFFSVEWPFYDGSEYNDLFIGWLESENWTGNVSFDTMGNPISLNASFFALKDNGGNLPEFDGTCMRKHGGTGWLTTTSAVTPGEDIIVVLAIFDMSDSILDSFVFVDNWEWGCMSEPGGPVTEPAG